MFPFSCEWRVKFHRQRAPAARTFLGLRVNAAIPSTINSSARASPWKFRASGSVVEIRCKPRQREAWLAVATEP
ncbi:hypothetical protein MAP00_006434 [Monascus purpureus]|nr:hypothetical protein MAP00_006434 [Monascus purpureus]